MKIQQIYYVMEIARVGSMNQAAKNLYVSQPHLSATIAELEKSLNITIFNRTSKGVKLTPVGELFIKSCQYIVDQLDYIESLYSNSANDERTLTVTSNCHNTIASSILHDMAKKETVCRTSTTFLTASSTSLLSDVAEQKYNLGLLVVPSLEMSALEGILNVRKLRFQCLLTENGCVMVGKNNPLYNEKMLTMKQCTKSPIAVLNDDWERAFSPSKLATFCQRFTLDDKESLFNAVLDGNCVAFADPTVNMRSWYVQSDNIRLIPLDESEHMSYHVGYVYKKGSCFNPIEQEFIDKYIAQLNEIEQSK